MKKIVFLTGTRADFGKQQSLIKKLQLDSSFDVHIFVTGMHLLSRYGYTAIEVERELKKNIYKFINQRHEDAMDVVLSKTISGFSDYIKEVQPDLIVVHGDRVEALAGAIVGSLNNIYVAHIEGGEVSGTIDELIRHAVSKMSHIHLVSNEAAKNRLIQLGENESVIHVIGSPDLDMMSAIKMPSLQQVKEYYDIPFSNYGILTYHPVTTEIDELESNIKAVIRAILQDDKNYIVIYPNNDMGSDIIIKELQKLNDQKRFRIYPSLRFAYYLSLMKSADLVIGNSSAGVREAPFYGVASINIGTRQQNRSNSVSIINVSENEAEILQAIDEQFGKRFQFDETFGDGNSSDLFYEVISNKSFFDVNKQKVFVDNVSRVIQ